MRVVLSADWVLAGYGVPRVCARHGEPAAGVKTVFRSRTPGWAYALLPLGVVPYFIAVHATGKTMLAPAWPFCVRCKALRTRNLVLGLSGIAVGIVLFCVTGAVANADFEGAEPLSYLLVMLTVAAIIRGVVVIGRAAPGALAQAWVREDGEWLDVWSPDRQFVAQVAMVAPQAVVQPTYVTPPR
jgi:hypothetical protein